jgi:hypothetical protein
VRVLVYGYLSDGPAVRTCLEALLREDFETVEVDFQAPPADMLYDSYYRTDKRDLVKGSLRAKAYDYTVLADKDAMALAYPEFWYSGVSAIAARAREFTGARTLLWIPSAAGLENGYRVANGTHSTPLPICKVQERVGAAVAMEKSFAAAAAVYCEIAGKAPAVSGALAEGVSRERMGELARIAAETLQSERRVSHYTTPFKGAVWIHGGPLPTSGEFGFLYRGTSTEYGVADVSDHLLRRAGRIAVPEQLDRTQAFKADAVTEEAKALLRGSPGKYSVAYARSWQFSASDLTEVDPGLQCQVYDKHGYLSSPEEAHLLLHREAGMLVSSWVTGRHAEAKKHGAAWLPMHTAMIRYNERRPEVAFSSDGTHMTAQYLQLLASMSYTSRTGLKAPAFGLEAAAADAVDEGFKIIRQLSSLSDSGYYVPDPPQANRPPTLDPIADTVLTVNAVNGSPAQAVLLTGITPGSPYENQSLSIALSSDNEALFPASSLSLTDVTYPAAQGTGGRATLRFQPKPGVTGRCRITVTLSDGQPENPSLTRSFEVEVAPGQWPTIQPVAPLVIQEDSEAVFTVTGLGSGNPGAGGKFRFYPDLLGLAKDKRKGFTANDPIASVEVLEVDEAAGTARVKVTLRKDYPWKTGQPRTQTFKLYVDNGERLNFRKSVAVDVAVQPVDDAPTLDAIADPAPRNEDSAAFSVNLPGISAGGGEEGLGQTVTVRAVSSNPALLPDPVIRYTPPGKAGTLVYQPVPNVSGSATVTVTVDDGNSSFSREFTVRIQPVNDAPRFVKGGGQTVPFNSGTRRVEGWATAISPGPVDEAAQSLGFLVTHSNTALFSAPPALSADGTLTFTPAAGRSGRSVVTVRLTDNGGVASDGADTSEPQTFTVTVADPPPQFDPIGNLAMREDAGAQGVSITGVVAGSDWGIRASSSNPLLVPDPEVVYTGGDTGRLVLKPAVDASGSATITVTLAGGVSGQPAFSRSFEVTVAAVNDAPRFEPGGDVVAGRETAKETPVRRVAWAGRIQSGPSDESGQQLVFETVVETGAELFLEPPSLALDGTLSYRPRTNAAGRATVKVRLRDDGGVAEGGADSSTWQRFAVILTDVGASAGGYYGLLEAPAETAPSYERSGRVILWLTKTGSFTARLDVGTETFTADGVMDHRGRARFGPSRAAAWTVARSAAPALTVDLNLDLVNGTAGMSVRVQSGETVFSEGVAERRVPPGPRIPGRYTAVFQSADQKNEEGRPGALGWLGVRAQADGSVILTGRLADGTSVSGSGSIGEGGRCSIFARSTNWVAKGGLVCGWVHFADRPAEQGTDLRGTELSWFPIALAQGKGVASGPAVRMSLEGSPYSAPTPEGGRALLDGLSPSGGAVRLTLSGGDLTRTRVLEFPLQWPYSFRTGQMVLNVDLPTGQLSGTILPSGKQPRLDFSGVVLQGENRATGFWVDPAGVGRMDLEVTGAPEPAPASSNKAAP